MNFDSVRKVIKANIAQIRDSQAYYGLYDCGDIIVETTTSGQLLVGPFVGLNVEDDEQPLYSPAMWFSLHYAGFDLESAEQVALIEQIKAIVAEELKQETPTMEEYNITSKAKTVEEAVDENLAFIIAQARKNIDNPDGFRLNIVLEEEE